ncbi:MAG: RNHCP domain-containing protein [Anaerolineaceae bacterium]|nr:RNHCP domain-containing protein [Anaerolineaceae bacterium]
MRKCFKPYFGDFTCNHCGSYISTDMALCGVNNRNHCPYCLHSKHVDLYQAGDRLSACKAPMEPVALALKKTNKKYGIKTQGELMLIHCCKDCRKLSINRIAADDIAENILEIFIRSHKLDYQVRAMLEQHGIQPLQPSDEEIVRARLFGFAYA